MSILDETSPKIPGRRLFFKVPDSSTSNRCSQVKCVLTHSLSG